MEAKKWRASIVSTPLAETGNCVTSAMILKMHEGKDAAVVAIFFEPRGISEEEQVENCILASKSPEMYALLEKVKEYLHRTHTQGNKENFALFTEIDTLLNEINR